MAVAMASGRISVLLTSSERQALVAIAERECRDPREHLRFLVRREAQAMGLLPDERVVGTEEKAVVGDREMPNGRRKALRKRRFMKTTGLEVDVRRRTLEDATAS